MCPTAAFGGLRHPLFVHRFPHQRGSSSFNAAAVSKCSQRVYLHVPQHHTSLLGTAIPILPPSQYHRWHETRWKEMKSCGSLHREISSRPASSTLPERLPGLHGASFLAIVIKLLHTCYLPLYITSWQSLGRYVAWKKLSHNLSIIALGR